MQMVGRRPSPFGVWAELANVRSGFCRFIRYGNNSARLIAALNERRRVGTAQAPT